MSDLVWFLEKSTLNPDLPYNRLLYNRFLLYFANPKFPEVVTVSDDQCTLHSGYKLRGFVGCKGCKKEQVRQCLGFYTADFWSWLVYESAVQKT